MRDVLGPGTTLGYCTNVHAGADWNQTKANLEYYASRVRNTVNPRGLMGVGLWLSQPALIDVIAKRHENALAEECARNGLIPFSFNAFPYGDFHQPVVKHAVYEPAWDKPERAGYTIAIAHVLAKLSQPGDERSISTLPIAWRRQEQTVDDYKVLLNLHMVANVLANLRASTGVLIHLDLEPEPGCLLQRSEDVVEFYELLLRESDESEIRTHIRICHDVCHGAVMFEDQAEVLARYRAAGIRVGKVQISNAVRADLRNLSARERTESLAQLRQFSEDRYLHQTIISDKTRLSFFEDLPFALSEFGTADRAGDEWRVHFHVPVYLDRFGILQTTQNAILQCLSAIRPEDEIHHFEVETYAWNVLPPELRVNDLADGIARELMWVRDMAASHRIPAA